MANTRASPIRERASSLSTAGPVARWNNTYTIFGEVVSGMPVVMAINRTPLRGDRPVDPPKLISVRIQRVGPEPKTKNKK